MAALPPDIIVFGPGANCTVEICPIQASVYGYRPSLAANTAFLSLFALASIIHVYISLRWRSWFFMTCMLFACLSGVIGYASRIIMYNSPFNFGGFMVQLIFVGTVPIWCCAVMYVTLPATIVHLSPNLSRLPPRLITWIFIPCDMTSLVFQAAGAALSARISGDTDVVVNLALFGLAFQLLVIATFCCLFADYLVRYFRSSRSLDRRVRLFLSFMGLSLLLIVVRSAFRLYELRDGFRGDSMKDEGMFIGFEGVLVVVSVYCLIIGHPGFALRDVKVRANLDGGGLSGDTGFTMLDTTVKPPSQKI